MTHYVKKCQVMLLKDVVDDVGDHQGGLQEAGLQQEELEEVEEGESIRHRWREKLLLQPFYLRKRNR